MNYTNFNYNINYYANIKDNKIIGSGARLLNEDILNIPITAEIAKNIQNYKFVAPDKIIPKTEDEIKVEKAQKERERLAQLSLTKREVFLALYKDKGITPEQLKAQITDPEALIEFEYANDYYRGNPLINQIGEKLGYSTEELDYLFKTGELPEKKAEEKPLTEDDVNNSETDVNNLEETKAKKSDSNIVSDIES